MSFMRLITWKSSCPKQNVTQLGFNRYFANKDWNL